MPSDFELNVELVDSFVRRLELVKATGCGRFATSWLIHFLSLLFFCLYYLNWYLTLMFTSDVALFVKNSESDATSKDIYRGIALSSIVSKRFWTIGYEYL